MHFSDRKDAGQRLASALDAYRDRHAVVLALPRGGVPVAYEVARHLNAPLELLLVRKIGLPGQRELAMGAVATGNVVIRNEEVIRIAGIDEAEFAAELAREQAELERRRQAYLGDRSPIDVAGRVAIVVDDGIATGSTMRAALKAVAAAKPAEIVLAVPVAPPETVASLKRHADKVVCLQMPPGFAAIGNYYADFHQLTDDDVRRLMISASGAPAGC